MVSRSKLIWAMAAAGVVIGGGAGVAAMAPVSPPQPVMVSVEGESRSTDLGAVLQPLVDDGTLTMAQRDAVVDRLDEVEAHGRLRRAVERVDGRQRRGGSWDVVADALGVTPREVLSGVRDGRSVAEQAEAAGVELSTVVDRLIEVKVDRLRAAVDAERLSDVEAVRKLAAFRERIVNMMNRDGSMGDVGIGRGGGPGRLR